MKIFYSYSGIFTHNGSEITRTCKSWKYIPLCLCMSVPLVNFLLGSWSHGNWIYSYLCNQCLSPLTLCVPTSFRRGVFDTTLCDKVCQWFETGQWFSLGTPVSSTNKTYLHDIAEILLKMAICTMQPTNQPFSLDIR